MTEREDFYEALDRYHREIDRLRDAADDDLPAVRADCEVQWQRVLEAREALRDSLR